MTIVTEHLEEYNFLIQPLINGFLGYKISGSKGALVGFGLGLAEEGARSVGYSFPKVLSAFFIGASSLTTPGQNTNLQTVGVSALGGALGVSVSLGLAGQYPILLSVCQNAFTGFIVGGPYYAVGGIALSYADKLLIDADITSAPLLSTALEGVAVIKTALDITSFLCKHSQTLSQYKFLQLDNKFSNYYIKPVLVATHVYFFASEKRDSFNAINLYNKLHDTYENTLGVGEFERIIENEMLASTALSVLIQQNHNVLFEDWMEMRLWTSAPSAHLMDTQASIGKIAGLSGKMLLKSIPGYVIPRLISDRLVKYYSSKLEAKMVKQVNSELYADQAMLKVLNNHNISNPQILVDRLSNDIKTITYNGPVLVNSAMSLAAMSLVSFKFLTDQSAEVLPVITSAYNYVSNNIMQWLSKLSSDKKKEIKEKKSLLTTKEKSVTASLKEITISKGMEFESEKIQELRTEIQGLEDDINDINLLLHFFQNPIRPDYSADYWLDTLVISVAILYKILDGSISKAGNVQVLSLVTATCRINDLQSWDGDNALKMNEIEAALKSFNELLFNIRALPENEDQITVINPESESQKMVLDSLRLQYNDKVIVDIDYLEFLPGIYAVTGKSGCGKTTTFTKVSGLQYDGVRSSGIVTYSMNSKVVFVTQKDYFPTHATLYESIMIPKKATEAEMLQDVYHEKIVNLLSYFEINLKIIDSLYVVDDWGQKLSGGQKKLISYIRAILQEPDVLFLDETPAGLDHHSLELLQNHLSQYTVAHPNTLVFIIDHEASNHNNTGFYTDHVHFANGTATLMPLSDEI